MIQRPHCTTIEEVTDRLASGPEVHALLTLLALVKTNMKTLRSDYFHPCHGLSIAGANGLSVGILAIALLACPAQAQQSYSFSFGSSSGFSSGSNRPKQERSPGEDADSDTPSASPNGFRNSQSQSVTNINGHTVEKNFEERDGQSVSTTRVRNGKQDVTIEESEAVGIRVTIKDLQRGKEKKTEYQAKTRKALKRKHPAAFEWVQKFAAEPNGGNTASFQFGNGTNATGGFEAGGFAGGVHGAQGVHGAIQGNGAVGGFGAGAFGGPEAQHRMQQQIEQMIQQSDDPAIKQQLRMLLDRLEAGGNAKAAPK